MMRTLALSTLLVSLALLSASSCYSALEVGGFVRGTKVGGWKEIEDVGENKEVQKLGEFSVQEYNRNQRSGGGGEVVFSEVVAARTQVVAGIKYHLKIAVQKNELPKTFDAIVVVKPWVRSKELVTFVPSTQ